MALQLAYWWKLVDLMGLLLAWQTVASLEELKVDELVALWRLVDE
jgi:hypothetical protein